MNAAVYLMVASFIMMCVIAGFLLFVNTRIQRQQRERYFGDIRHVKIPDDPAELKKKPKPPYRIF